MKKLIISLGVTMAFFSKAQAAELTVGAAAPDFTAAASDGTQVHLKDWLDRAPIVLYFYPKDDTPGCTKEACSFRDNFKAFRDLHATVFGVSYDSVQSHQKFIEKYHLPFLLLADQDKKIAKAYGADGIIVASRQTFVIDPAGHVVYINRSVNPSTHAAELQDVLAKLAPSK